MKQQEMAILEKMTDDELAPFEAIESVLVKKHISEEDIEPFRAEPERMPI